MINLFKTEQFIGILNEYNAELVAEWKEVKK